MKHDLKALLGAVIGGAVGFVAFGYLLRFGLYGALLPGGLLGLGAGMVKHRSLWVAPLCGLAALALGIVAEWNYAPFRDDHRFSFFVANLFELRPFKLIMIAGGALLGLLIPYQQREVVQVPTPAVESVKAEEPPSQS